MRLHIFKRLKNENFYWIIGFYTLILAGVTHFLFIFLFLFLEISSLVTVNILSVLVYLYCIFGLSMKTLESKDDSLIGWLVYAELMGHGVISTYFLGLESGFQYYIYTLLLIPFFISTYAMPVRLLRMAGVIVVSLLLEIWGQSHAPMVALSSTSLHTLHYMNLTLSLMMVGVVSYLYTLHGQIYQNLLFEKSNNDPLTKLYNRRYVDEAFENERIRHQNNESTFALLLIDIDYFKKINDLYGHRCGDDVLIRLASILKAHVRDTTIVSRWGGEEFLVVLENSSADELKATAERLRRAVEDAVISETKSIQITVTIGGAVSQADETFQMTLSRADNALYQGKHHGRNQVCLA